MDDKARGVVEMSLAMVISGTIGWFVIMTGRPVLDVVFWRCVFGAIALFALCAGLGLFRRRITWRQFALAVLGGVAIVLNWLLLFGAYAHASISIATAIYNTQPFMLFVFGAVMFSERITTMRMTWLLLAFGGLLLIIMYKPTAEYVGNDEYALGIVIGVQRGPRLGSCGSHDEKPDGGAATTHRADPCLHGGDHALAVRRTWWFACRHPNLVAPRHGRRRSYRPYVRADVQRRAAAPNIYLQGALSFIYPAVAILIDVIAFQHHLQLVQIVGVFIILVSASGTTLGINPFPRRLARHEVGTK